MSMQLATRAFGVIDISEVQDKLDSIEKLESKIKAQQELIDIMREALEFYSKGTPYNFDWGDKFLESDIDFNEGLQLSMTGKLARLSLEKLEQR